MTETTTAELAADAFDKRQRVTILEMQNTPQDYDEAKRGFIQLAEAREAARVAELKLADRVDRPGSCK